MESSFPSGSGSRPAQNSARESAKREIEALKAPAIEIAVRCHDFWFRGGEIHKLQMQSDCPKRAIFKHSFGKLTEGTLKRGCHWLDESPFLPYDWKTISPHGTSTLKDTAMRVAMSDQSRLRPSIFKNIPYHLAKYIWEWLAGCDKQTLYMWKLLSSTYPDEFWKISPYYCLVTASRNSPMRHYIEIMNSDKIHWCGIFSVSTNLLDEMEIISIGHMTNLGALEINKLLPIDASKGDWAFKGGMTDRIIKTWVQYAKDKSTLQHLRVIKFRNQDQITPHMLAYLSELPELQFVITQNCTQFTGASVCNPIFAQAGNRNKSDPRVHGWIARTLKSIEKTDGRGAQVLRPLIHLYHDPPNETWQSFQDMAPIRPLPFGENVPVMEFQTPYCDRNKFSYSQQQDKPKDVCCFVRSKDALATFKRRRDAMPEGRPRAQKRVMKERGPQADMMNEIMGSYNAFSRGF